MRRGHAVERVPRFEQPPGVHIQHTKFQVARKRCSSQPASILEGRDRGGGLSVLHRQPPLPDAHECQGFDGRLLLGRLGHDLLEHRDRLRPVLAARVMQREIDAHVGGARGHRGRLLEGLERQRVLAERRIRRGEAQRRIEVERVRLQDRFQERNRLAVPLLDEEVSGPIHGLEEMDHVDGAWRILPDDWRRTRAHISEACQAASGFVAEGGGRGGGLDRRHWIVVERLPHLGREVGSRAQVPRLQRIAGHVVDLRRAREDRLALSLDGHDLRLPPVAEERLHGFGEDDFARRRAQAIRRIESGQIEQGVENPACADRRRLTAGGDTRGHHHHGHPHCRLIEQIAVLELTVVPEPLAVIAGHHDGARSGDVLFECLHETAKLFVHRGDLAKVRLVAVAIRKRRGRSVRGMRIEVVDPQQQRLVGPLREVSNSPVGSLLRCPLGPSLPFVVVEVEPARQAESLREHEGRDERRGPVPSLLQPFGGERMRFIQEPRVLVDAVPGGVEARHHRRVRGERFRNGRVGVAEAPPSGRQCIEGRRLDPLRLGPDRIRSCRVERDEKDGMPDRRGGRSFAVARGQQQHGEQDSQRSFHDDSARYCACTAAPSKPASGLRITDRGIVATRCAIGSLSRNASRNRPDSRAGRILGAMPPPT